MTWHDFNVVCAHYALQDPKKTMQKQIEDEETIARIKRKRRLRAKQQQP